MTLFTGNTENMLISPYMESPSFASSASFGRGSGRRKLSPSVSAWIFKSLEIT